MGRPGDAAAVLRTSFDVDRQSPPSFRVKTILYINAASLALLEANRGRFKQAEESLALARPWKAYIEANAPAGFYADLWAPAEDFFRLQIAQLAGDNRHVLETGPRLIAGVEKLKPTDGGQRRIMDESLRPMYAAVAQSAYTLGDYATAERAMAKLAELRSHQPALTLGEKRAVAFEQAFQAAVLTRVDRKPQAQKLIAPVLDFERDLSRRNRDDPSQRVELALALYGAAVAGLGDPAAQLAEASAVMEKLPPEMQGQHDVTLLRGFINEERSRRPRS